jgi:hypothetical protein
MLYADLQVIRTKDGLTPRVRISRRIRTSEKFLGFAHLNRDLELVRRPEELTEGEQAAIEKAIVDHVGPVE